MIDAEGRLESVLGTLVEVCELGAGVEYEYVDLCGAQPIADGLRKCPDAGEAAQVERKCVDRGMAFATSTKEQSRIRRPEYLLRGDFAQA